MMTYVLIAAVVIFVVTLLLSAAQVVASKTRFSQTQAANKSGPLIEANRQEQARREKSIRSQLQSKFEKIHERIEAFRLMVHQKEQCLFFFETYSHTRDSLLNSPELSTIHSHMRIVHHQVAGWQQAGQLTNAVIECYEQLREDTIKHRDRMFDELNRRGPTFFEHLQWFAVVAAQGLESVVCVQRDRRPV